MSQYRRRSYTAPELNEEAWLGWIEETYGVVLGDGQLYVDGRNRFVYAGSEYIARVGHDGEPENATDWAESIAHRPRHLKTTEEVAVAVVGLLDHLAVGSVAARAALDAAEAILVALERANECGNSISTGGHDPYGTTCDLPHGHDGPHAGPDYFGEGRMTWEGGGSCAGDPLPVRNAQHIR